MHSAVIAVTRPKRQQLGGIGRPEESAIVPVGNLAVGRQHKSLMRLARVDDDVAVFRISLPPLVRGVRIETRSIFPLGADSGDGSVAAGIVVGASPAVSLSSLAVRSYFHSIPPASNSTKRSE